MCVPDPGAALRVVELACKVLRTLLGAQHVCGSWLVTRFVRCLLGVFVTARQRCHPQ